MTTLIDGHNAIHRLGMEGPTHEAIRHALLTRVRALDPTAIVFFDARGAPAGLPEVRSEAGVSVRYCKTVEADTEILRAVHDHTRPASLLVVSDDAELTGRSRSLGARSSSISAWFAPPRAEAPEARPEGPAGFRPGDFGLADVVDLDAPPGDLAQE